MTTEVKIPASREPSAPRGAFAAPLEPRPLLAAMALCRREWVRFIRQRNRVFGAIGQPIIFWLLFGLGLGPSFQAPGVAAGVVNYREYFFPGSLTLILLFTSIFTSISIIEDRREGLMQSVLVAPLPRWSMVLGKLLGGSLIALAQGLIFLLLAPTQGIAFTPLSLAAIVVFTFLTSLALTGLGFIFAWRLDSSQGFHAIMSVVLFPMWLLSGAFFPAPPWRAGMGLGEAGMAIVMQLNPLTYAVAGLRRLLYLSIETPPVPTDTPALALCWGVTIGFALLMFALSVKISEQRTTADLL